MNTELVLIPCTWKGHLTPAVEFAKLLVTRSQRLSITVLLIKFPLDQNLTAYADSDRIKFIDITRCADLSEAPSETTSPLVFIEWFIKSHRSEVRSAAISGNKLLRGFVLDIVCMSMSDVASELGVPTYVFCPANAGFLSLILHLQEFDNRDSTIDSADSFHSFPGFARPIPRTVIPSALFNSSAPLLFDLAKRVRESRGVVINTSVEIEPHALRALTSLPVYAVGPVVSPPGSIDGDGAIAWLDGQPRGSVLFLCFGSKGSFSVDQSREMAKAIESTGVRFLWTLRQHSTDGKTVLPEGFITRTAERGRVIRWALQTAVLAHPAVGGFVSHCGWNSVLESLWFGVPIATWPLYAEQQLNAFEMVVELGLAVEVKMDYISGLAQCLVRAEVIEAAIVKVMDGESEIRKNVKEMSVKCRNSVVLGGSSFTSLDRFVSNVCSL